MKTLAVLLSLSSVSIVALANMPKKPLPTKSFQVSSLSIPNPVPPPKVVQKAQPAVAMQFSGAYWWGVEIGTGSGAYSAIIQTGTSAPPPVAAVYCGPFNSAQGVVDELNRRGGLWMGGGVGGHMPASLNMVQAFP